MEQNQSGEERKELNHVSATDPIVEQAKQLIQYFQGLVDRQGAKWLLGLYMAKQWLKMLGEKHPTPEEIGLFLRVMEAERPNQGSGWSDLYFHVQYWANNISSVDKSP